MAYEGPIIDVHTHPVVSMGSLEGKPAELRALAAEAGVTRAGALFMAPRGKPEETRAGNDEVILLASDGFFYPVCSVHPFDGPDALAELERVRELGVRWLKLHPNTQAFDVAAPEVATVVERAGELDMTVLFDSFSPFDADQPGKFVKLAGACPRTRLVLAHLFAARFHEAITFAIMRRHYPEMAGPVYFDLSFLASLYAGSPYADHVAWTVRQLGVDRVLFGSDYPIDSPARAVAAVRELGFTEGEQQAMFYDNAAGLPGCLA